MLPNTYQRKRAAAVGLVVSQTKQLITHLKTWLHNNIKNRIITRIRNKSLFNNNKINMIKRWTKSKDHQEIIKSIKILITVKCIVHFQEPVQINLVHKQVI